LKLLAALFNGRHCIVNTPMVANTGLEDLCLIADEADKMAAQIEQTFSTSFDMNEKKKREAVLSESFSNGVNVKKLMELF
jgi:hypothetical protein